MAGRKRRDNGPVAAPAETIGNASNTHSSAERFDSTCVAGKDDPALWESARNIPTRALETETNPERRRNIEACLKYVNENGYPYPDEVFIAMDGVVKHMTERESWAMDWRSLAASGKKDEAFVMLGPDYGPDVNPPKLSK